ncbi:MAG: hypothetical protein MHM6MM_005944 [Cercozoa sp. M6MM]
MAATAGGSTHKERQRDNDVRNQSRQPLKKAKPRGTKARSAFGLRYIEDVRTLCFLAAWPLCLALWWSFWPSMSLPLRCLAIAVQMLLSGVASVVTHNVMHVPLFVPKFKAANAVVQVLLTFAYGMPVTAYVPAHNLSHHRYTQLKKDVFRTSKAPFGTRLHLLNLLFYPSQCSMAALKGDMRFLRVMHAHKRPFFPQVLRELWLLLCFDIAVLLFDWRLALWLILLPQHFAQWLIVNMNLLQHDGCETRDHSETKAQVLNDSRDFVGTCFNLLLFNNGYHSAHHAHPTAHWTQLPAIHEESIAKSQDPRLREPNFLRYVWRTFFYPGVRLHFDGTPWRMPPAVGDDDFVPYPESLCKEDVSYSLTENLSYMCKALLLVLFKITIPAYSMTEAALRAEATGGKTTDGTERCSTDIDFSERKSR